MYVLDEHFVCNWNDIFCMNWITAIAFVLNSTFGLLDHITNMFNNMSHTLMDKIMIQFTC